MEKPKMYQNKINKVFHNNKLIYMSNNTKSYNPTKVNDIKNKIDNILNDNSFIYRAKVKLVINDKVISKKIIGISNNNLITIDNEYIPIDSIQDIYKENKAK